MSLIGRPSPIPNENHSGMLYGGRWAFFPGRDSWTQVELRRGNADLTEGNSPPTLWRTRGTTVHFA